MAWIDIINPLEADSELTELYNQIRAPNGQIDNVLQIHSLRPRTLTAHLVLYKAVLHTRPNELSYRERELIGSYVSALNECNYCVDHHTAGLGRFIRDEELAKNLVKEAITDVNPILLTEREKVMCAYAKKLTLHPQQMIEEDVIKLRDIGVPDAGILDLNQIISYFGYVNRMVNGLGVDTLGEVLGLHPSDNEEGFKHA